MSAKADLLVSELSDVLTDPFASSYYHHVALQLNLLYLIRGNIETINFVLCHGAYDILCICFYLVIVLK